MYDRTNDQQIHCTCTVSDHTHRVLAQRSVNYLRTSWPEQVVFYIQPVTYLLTFDLSARLSEHEDLEDLDYEEIEAVLHSNRRDPLTRAKKAVHRLVQRVGFFGILLCASVRLSVVWGVVDL